MINISLQIKDGKFDLKKILELSRITDEEPKKKQEYTDCINKGNFIFFYLKLDF